MEDILIFREKYGATNAYEIPSNVYMLILVRRIRSGYLVTFVWDNFTV